MKRHNHLYSQICSLENLEEAWKYVRLGKRYDKEVLRFGYRIFENLIHLHNELTWKTYRVGKYREFTIRDPKERLIQYLPLRDRIVQQALHQLINPLFDKGFIDDSYACRNGKGTHRAMKRLQYFLNAAQQKWGAEPHYLHCDIRKYFRNIDHGIIYGLICRKIKCPDTLQLIKTIVDSSLSSPGLPIGSLFSQLSANIYLNVLDQFVKHDLRERYYLRYMDNFIIIHHNKRHLQHLKEEIRGLLENRLHLELNPKGTMINKSGNGIEFVGYRVYVDRVKIKKASIKRIKKRLTVMQAMYRKRTMSLGEITQRIRSWLGHCCHADARMLAKNVLSGTVFTREGR
jgi:retron-type reverse transcriptase